MAVTTARPIFSFSSSQRLASVGNAGRGRFLVPGEEDVVYSLDYIESTGTQVLDTGYTPKSATILEMNFGHWKTVNNAVVFGANRYNTSAYLLLDQSGGFRYYGSLSNTGLLPTGAAALSKDFFVHIEPSNCYMTSGSDRAGSTEQTSLVDASVNQQLSFFAMRNSAGTAYEKYSSCRLYDCKIWANAVTFDSTGLLAYPALTLDAGTFSLKNEAAETCRVTGALKINGGVTLAIDRTDAITAGSVDLSGASRENPVLILIDDPSRVIGRSAILCGARLAGEDAEKFAIPGAGEKVRMVVRNGDLYLKGQNGLCLIFR